MKFKILVLFSIMFLSLYGQEPSEDFTERKSFSEQAMYRTKAAFLEYSGYNDYDLTYQRMEWEINPSVKFIKGSVTSYIKSKIPALSSVIFNLHNAMIVDSVYQDKRKLTFLHEDDQLFIQLPNTVPSGITDSLTIYYQGSPGDSGFGSFEQSFHSGIPVIWTLSEPYGAMEWWPCKESLSDKIDSIDVIVTCPGQFRTAGNGILLSENVENGHRKMHWRHRFPIATYLVAIAVTDYAEYSDSLKLTDGSIIKIQNFVYPENLNDSKIKTPVTAAVMKIYNNLIGKYPFASEKYGHAQFGWGGGMEHQTMSFMYNFSFELIAHELAHQWFGDFITLSSWHDIWLNEGFATYLTGLAYENLFHDSYWPQWKKIQVDRITVQPDGSVYVSDTANISRLFSGRLSYSKGAYLLHMLRWILGDENFFNALKNYFNDPLIANGFASHGQLVRHFELAGDTTLIEFFNDWYYGEGFPVYSIRYGQNADFTVIMKIYQKPSHNSVGFFEMPVPVRIISSSGADTLDLRLANSYNGQEFSFNPGFRIGSIKIDPELWMVSKTGTVLELPFEKFPKEIEVFPNPTNGNIQIFLPQGENVVKTSLFDISGRKILEEKSGKTKFFFSDLPGGIYLMRIKTNSGNHEKKIIKI